VGAVRSHTQNKNTCICARFANNVYLSCIYKSKP